MKSTKIRIPRQQGFAGVVFLVIALMAVIMTAVASMSRNNAAGTQDQTNRTNASVILKQASDLKTGFDRMLIDGRAPSAITFDNVGANGLFSAATGTIYAVKPIPPALAVAPSTTPQFTFNNAVTLPGIGSAAADAVFTIGNLSEPVCLQINQLLYNDAATATPAESTGSLAAWSTVPAAIADGGVTATNYLARPEGCVRASGGGYVYYKAASEN